MKAQLAYIRYKLDSSFWFVPGLMILGAVLLSFSLVTLDRAFLRASVDVSGWLYSATPDGARQLLVAIAGATITVTSLVFSMTLVALTLASQQLGPRLLENFMRNRANQLVIGYFVATFVYALLVLRTVSDLDEARFVPVVATVTAIGLSIISAGVLIFFIHHVAGSIQADAVVANVSANLDKLIASHFPEPCGEKAPGPPMRDVWPEMFEANSVPVRALESGYIQTQDIEALRRIAVEHELLLQVALRPGHFVVQEFPLAYAFPGVRVSDELQKEICGNVVIGPKRTSAQDVEYEIRVIAEIAVRALSAGINDFYTATTCVDRLTAALVAIMHRTMPPSDVSDEKGKIVLRIVPPDFDGMIDTAFNDIRQCAQGNTAVTIRLLEALSVLARAGPRGEQRRAIHRHVEMVGRSAAEFIFDPEDRSDAEARLRTARHLIADK